jgi:hypothetical protein
MERRMQPRLQRPEEEEVLDIKKRNCTFKRHQKLEILRALQKYTSDQDIKKGIANLQRRSKLYSSITVEKVKRWRKAAYVPKMKKGRKVSVEFENTVWSKMILCLYDDEDKCKVIHNVCYTYEIIKRSVRLTLDEGWRDDPIVRKLKFSGSCSPGSCSQWNSEEVGVPSGDSVE